MLILPWLSLFFLKKESIKRYMPVTIFTALLVTITFEIAYVYKWWVIKEEIVPWGNITNVSFAYGMFFIGTMWIFYFTYRKFWVYLFTNLVVDGLYVFFFAKLIEGKIRVLVNIDKPTLFFVMILQALIIYGYQVWQEGIFKGYQEKDEKESSQ
jgi:hypothetical protein